MCPRRKKTPSRGEVLNFTYPKLHTGKKWYVDFLAYDPATGTMRRKKYHLDGIKKVTERRKRGVELIESLLKMLRQGWSPWVQLDESRGFVSIELVLEKYEKFIEKLDREKTRKSYLSMLNTLRIYFSEQVIKPKYIYQFDVTLVASFLDWLYLDREVSPRTRNNYRVWCSSLSEFLIERGYLGSNPVSKIKPLPEMPKKRQPLTPEMLSHLQSHLDKENKMFLLACRMEYYTFIRPGELTSIRIGDISVKEQSVFISAEFSKNRRDGKVGLNDEVIKLMIDLEVLSKPSDWYLFGPKMAPSRTRADSEIFRRHWLKVRKHLRWGDEYQFYSLKDSGIRDLANSEGIVIARDQARHSDVSTTNRYLKGRDLPVHDETKHFKGSL